MLQALKRRWFLLLLVATVAIGMTWAESLESVSARLPRRWIIGSVLLAMALPLKVDAMWATLRKPRPAILATAINFLLVPLFAWLGSQLLTEDLALGLIVAAAVPSTLASAAVWTRLAGGNDAVSLLVTMITNLGCFVVTPAILFVLAGRDDSSIDFAEMAVKLLVLIVLPIMGAQLLRSIPPVGDWATTNKTLLSTYAQIGLLTIVFSGAVNGGLKLASLEGQLAPIAGQIGLMMIVVAAVHTAAWFAAYHLAATLGIAREEQLAVAFSGSQKTLMVGLAIALSFGGLTVLPMLAYHIEQLLIDTLLADRYRINSTAETTT